MKIQIHITREDVYRFAREKAKEGGVDLGAIKNEEIRPFWPEWCTSSEGQQQAFYSGDTFSELVVVFQGEVGS